MKNLLVSFLAGFIFVISLKSFSEEATALKKKCAELEKLQFPSEDQPTKVNSIDPSDCEKPEADYYHEKRDLQKVRLCAFAQLKNKEKMMFNGQDILMMIYANGLGVKQNLSLAEKMACAVEGAPAELEGRMKHLESLKSGKKEIVPFDICDDITSGFMQGHCSSIEEEIAKRKRDRDFQTFIEKWSDSEKVALKELQVAAQEFAEARSQNEVDLSGTARAAFIIAEKSIQERDFADSIQKLVTKKAPKYTSQQLKVEDQKLNSIYTKIQRQKSADLWGTVTKDDIKKVQQTWIKYRDAWIKFAKVKFPEVPSDSISAWFTKKRNHMLRSFEN